MEPQIFGWPASIMPRAFNTFSTLLFIFIAYVTFAFYSCRLKHLPGPISSNVTSLPYDFHGYKNTSNQYVRALHNAYGPVVRVTPNLVSFSSVEAITAIYGVRSNFPKPPHISNLDNYGKPNTFSTVSNEEHRRRRSRYASTFSKSNITIGAGYDGIMRRTEKVLKFIRNAMQEGQSVDIYKLFHYYALDNASVITAGISMGLLDGKNLKFSCDLREVFQGLTYVYYFPVVSFFLWLMPKLSQYVIPRRMLMAVQAHKRVQKSNMEHYVKSKTSTKIEFEKAVSLRLRGHRDYNSPALTEMHVASEVCDQILAGADTLVAGLVYTFWELILPTHKTYLDRLKAELELVEWTAEGHPVSYSQIDTLKWLDCCIHEGLRLHMPSGNIQARTVPKGGATVAGYAVPEETEVGISLYSILLNEDIFENPFSFEPERWLEENNEPEKLQEMNSAWLTFGTGARGCIGKELALVQMKLLLAVIFYEFSVSVDKAQDEDEMEELQMAVLAPKGGRCLLRFSKLDHEAPRTI